MGITGKDQVYIAEVTDHLRQAMVHRAKAVEMLQKAAGSGQVSDDAILVITILHVEWERAIKNNSLEDFAKGCGVQIRSLKDLTDEAGVADLQNQFSEQFRKQYGFDPQFNHPPASKDEG